VAGTARIIIIIISTLLVYSSYCNKRRLSAAIGNRRVCEALWPPPLEHYCWQTQQSIRRRGNRLKRAQCGALGKFYRRRTVRVVVIFRFDLSVSCARQI